MKRLGTVLVVLFSGVLLACQLQYVLPTPEPSAAPRATRTRTPGSAGATAAPTFPALQVLPTLPQGGPVSASVIATAKENLRVRAAPSASSQQVGSLNKGDTAQIVGRTAANDWWQILLPSNFSVRGWVLASFTDVSGSIGSIPITTSGSAPAPQPYPVKPSPEL